MDTQKCVYQKYIITVITSEQSERRFFVNVYGRYFNPAWPSGSYELYISRTMEVNSMKHKQKDAPYSKLKAY